MARERVVFNDEFLNAVAEETVNSREELQRRIEALQKCVARLPKDHRELLRLRYDERRSVGSVAQIVNRPLEGVTRRSPAFGWRFTPAFNAVFLPVKHDSGP